MASAACQEETLPSPGNSTAPSPRIEPPASVDDGNGPGPRWSRRRILITAGLAILGLLLFVVVWVGVRGLIAKNALEAAQADLSQFRDSFGTSSGGSLALYERIQERTSTAAASVGDPVWAAAEVAPAVGDDLRAFRQVTQLTDRLVRDGLGPLTEAADGFSLESLEPIDGRIDLEPITRLAPGVAAMGAATERALEDVAEIDTSGTLPAISDAVERIEGGLAEYGPALVAAGNAFPLLQGALGGEEPRYYLLMFQNNAEERASGGNPASMALLKVDDGAIDLVQQAGSRDFDAPYAEEPLTFGGDWPKLFGWYASSYVTNITFTPDFPTTAKLAQRMWELEFGRTVDGVISFDPVALSYLLEATGPIGLATGEELTQENAVDFLLNGVYAKYPDPAVQDAVFASAAERIFDAVTSGASDPEAFLAQLGPMIEEQRLKMWSTRETEQAAIRATPVGNMLPPDNSATTTLGVYNNDDSTSKMSFYMDATIDVEADRCSAEPSFAVSTTVTNTLERARATELAEYVRPHQERIPVGGDRQWVLLYGPVGSTLESAQIDGDEVIFGDNYKYDDNTVPDATGIDDFRPAVSGTMDGRPVAIVSIKMGPEESRTVGARFVGGDGATTPITVSHTPKVRPTPVSVTERTCD